eukprot:7988341-Pyramimonas_sp.AAC.1
MEPRKELDALEEDDEFEEFANEGRPPLQGFTERISTTRRPALPPRLNDPRCHCTCRVASFRFCFQQARFAK